MTDYAGDPSSFPTTFPLLADNSLPSGSEINVPIETLADRTAYLKAQTDNYHARFDRARLLNWTTVARTDIVSAAVARHFNGRTFVAAQLGERLYVTGDFGATISANLVASVSAGELISDLAFDTNGSVVATTNSRYVYDVAFNNLSTAKRDVVGSAVTPYSSVVFLPAFGYWLVVTATSAGSSAAFKSTDRATWVTTGVVSPFSSANNGLRIRTNPAGVILAILCGTTTNFRAAVSSNGGASWSSNVLTAVGSVAFTPSEAQITWDTVRARWVVVLSSSAGSDVFTSPDGVTWTKRAALNNRIGRVSVDEDGVYVACVMGASAANSGIVASVDGGANWVSLGIKTSGATNTYAHAFETLGGIAVLASDGATTRIHQSLQTGNPTLQAVI